MGDKHAYSGSTCASSGITSPKMAATDYSAILWGADPQSSTMLPYIRDHADQMISRVRSEDPRTHYQALKQVHDVCLYKRLAQPQEAVTGASPLATSITSSFSSLTSSRRGVSVTAESAQIPGNFDFRGITKVPGTVDSVMDMLSSESARETYWMALNTLKDVRAAALLSTARLQSQQSIGSEMDADEDATAFPRWCRKYTAMKLSKQSSKIMDCCFAEYATKCTETNNDGHSRKRGFVYRRSVSEQALTNAASVSADLLNKSRVHGAATFYLQDWLFDVVETHEPFVCKLVLTCSVFIPPGRSGPTPRSEFREFCTELLVGARRALTHQWKDQAAHAGFRSSSWRRESRYCSVCSAQFSLLRKRYMCRSCDSGVCSRCCSKTVTRGQQKKECLLCTQFGPENKLDEAEVNANRELFSSSMASLSISSSRGFTFTESVRMAQLDFEREDLDRVHPDLELRTTSSISGSRSRSRSQRRRSQRSVSSIGSQHSISGLEDEDVEAEEEVRPYVPHLDLRSTTSSVKMRTASTESAQSARSNPGVVLLSDLDTLSLSGSFHRPASMSASMSSRSSTTSIRLPAKSAAPSPAQLQTKRPVQQQTHRQDRAASEDNVVLYAIPNNPRTGTKEAPQESSASTVDDEEVYAEDDLANFTLKLL